MTGSQIASVAVGSDGLGSHEVQRGNGRPPAQPRLPAKRAHGAAEPFGGARLLAADVRVAYLLANEARYRALQWAFGASRDQANLLTFVVILMAAEAAHDKVERAVHGLRGPTRADALLGTAVANELLGEIAGRPARDTPMFGALVALALVGGLSAPAVRRSMQVISSNSSRMLLAFRHRYGYLVAHGRRIARRQRLQARAQAGERKPDSTGNGEVASRIREVAQ